MVYFIRFLWVKHTCIWYSFKQDKASLSGIMEIFMKETLSMIKLKEKASTSLKLETAMREEWSTGRG